MTIPFNAVRRWIDQSALPLWSACGVDPVFGGFLEEIAPDGSATACAFKRVRVQCRQMYVFSHAAALGHAGAERPAHLGYEFLMRHARQADGAWARLLSRAGEILDPTPYLYDFAFVIFAMAWRYRAFADDDALAEAHAALDFVQQRFAIGDGGYWAQLTPNAPRLQNPIMHLTEACLAAFEASQDERFLAQARALVTLFRKRLFDGSNLAERFTEDWRRSNGEGGQILEPGHHFEWAWILGQYKRLTGESTAKDAYALARFAEQHGLNPISGAVYDAVRDNGAPVRSGSRLWTNTERLKAWLAVYELTGRDPSAELQSVLSLIFDRYFAPAIPGAWADQLDENGEPKPGPVPASIVYHLFLAFQELLRLEPALTSKAHAR